MTFKLATMSLVLLALPACVVVNEPHHAPPAAATPVTPAVAATPQPVYQDPPAAPPPGEEPRSIAAGRPPHLQAGQAEAYWVWHDTGGWHVRTTTHSHDHRFSGRVWGLRGEVGNIHTTRTEWNDRFRKSGREMAFDFHTNGNEDGFDFQIAEGDCAQFYLLIDNQPNPARVFVGATEHHPAAASFRLCQ